MVTTIKPKTTLFNFPGDFLGPLFMFLAIVIWIYSTLEYSRYEQAPATVQKVTGTRKDNWVHVEFKLPDGQSVQVVDNTKETRYSIGESVTVYYLPNNPKKAVLRQHVMANQAGVFLSFLVGLFMCFSSFVNRRVEMENQINSDS